MEAVHVVEGQFIPPVLEVTVPLPFPLPLGMTTVRFKFPAFGLVLNMAETETLALRGPEQVLPIIVAPEAELQTPPQPAKIDPATGAAVKVIGVPLANEAEHMPPQLIPDGLERTIPLPVPDFDTVIVLMLPPL